RRSRRTRRSAGRRSSGGGRGGPGRAVAEPGVRLMAVKAYVALGSDLSDRQDYAGRALDALRDHPAVKVLQTSSVVETAPVGGPPGQGPYLNAAAEVEPTL